MKKETFGLKFREFNLCYNDLRHKKIFKFFYITLKSCCIPNKSSDEAKEMADDSAKVIADIKEDAKDGFTLKEISDHVFE
jgi:hypothetical protein